jgi:hypothetical protein
VVQARDVVALGDGSCRTEYIKYGAVQHTTVFVNSGSAVPKSRVQQRGVRARKIVASDGLTFVHASVSTGGGADSPFVEGGTQSDHNARGFFLSREMSCGMEGGGTEIVRQDSTSFNVLYRVQVITSGWSPA